MTLFRKVVGKILGRGSKFRVGDTVELRDQPSKNVMVVIEIMDSLRMDKPLIHCQWYESETKQNRKCIFREDDLEFFNWHSAKAKTVEPTDVKPLPRP
ncbi:MAG: hypothetical protein AB7K37_13150 [Cyclobacteriaceae bacterium]